MGNQVLEQSLAILEYHVAEVLEGLFIMDVGIDSCVSDIYDTMIALKQRMSILVEGLIEVWSSQASSVKLVAEFARGNGILGDDGCLCTIERIAVGECHVVTTCTIYMVATRTFHNCGCPAVSHSGTLVTCPSCEGCSLSITRDITSHIAVGHQEAACAAIAATDNTSHILSATCYATLVTQIGEGGCTTACTTADEAHITFTVDVAVITEYQIAYVGASAYSSEETYEHVVRLFDVETADAMHSTVKRTCERNLLRSDGLNGLACEIDVGSETSLDGGIIVGHHMRKPYHMIGRRE